MHLLPRFGYYDPKDCIEACRLLFEMKDEAKVLAGGTDVLVNMKKGLLKTPNVVSILGIPELRGVEMLDRCFSLGATLFASEIAESDVLRQKFPSLAKAVRMLGSPSIQNRATLGGNIVRASPAADLPPPLIAYGARVVLQSTKGEREFRLDDFFLGPEKTVIDPTEVLTRILVDEPAAHTGSDYIKLGHRNALECAIVSVASRLTLDKPDGIIRDAKVILGSVAPTTIHAPKAEKTLTGETPSEGLFDRVAAIASTECSPIDDMRGSAAYRRSMVAVLTKRTLMTSWQEARGANK